MRLRLGNGQEPFPSPGIRADMLTGGMGEAGDAGLLCATVATEGLLDDGLVRDVSG